MEPDNQTQTWTPLALLACPLASCLRCHHLAGLDREGRLIDPHPFDRRWLYQTVKGRAAGPGAQAFAPGWGPHRCPPPVASDP